MTTIKYLFSASCAHIPGCTQRPEPRSACLRIYKQEPTNNRSNNNSNNNSKNDSKQ